MIQTINFELNGKPEQLTIDDDMILMWVLRINFGLTGTKYGCGLGFCGACTVIVDNEPVRSCMVPAVQMAGVGITTIEGLDPDGRHPVQRAWHAEDVPQCGYCQSGQLIGAYVLLKDNPEPSDLDIDRAMSEYLCRCGTYQRIRRAIHRAAGEVNNVARR